MDFQNLLSFEGRQRRLHFWIVAIVIGVINSVLYSVAVAPIIMAMVSGHPAPGVGALSLVCSLLMVALLWPSVANSVKRLHDRDKSGWWLLGMYLAIFTVIGALWPLIELGFLDGTPGPNKYGPSPKGLTGPALTPA